jgi:hypothetical protein
MSPALESATSVAATNPKLSSAVIAAARHKVGSSSGLGVPLGMEILDNHVHAADTWGTCSDTVGAVLFGGLFGVFGQQGACLVLVGRSHLRYLRFMHAPESVIR